MLSQLLNTPCTIVRRSGSGEIDEYGDEQEDEETVETFCELQQRQRSEPAAYGELSDTSWLLVLPAGTEIDTGDGVIVDGRVFEMVGDPWEVRNPRTKEGSHVEATLRRTGTEVGS